MNPLMEALPMRAPQRRRTTTGCIGCRLRRKKCSLDKPRCANCLRNCILCTWPEPGNEQHAQLLRRTNPTRRQQSPQTPAGRRGVDENVVLPKPCSGETITSPSLKSYLREAETESRLTLLKVLSQVPRPLDPQMLQGNSILRRPASQRLFHHYIRRTNKVMAVCRGQKNPFVTELIPMVMANDIVLNAVLACSGIHLANSSGVCVDEVTWTHYGQAIQGQKFALTQLSQGNPDVLVTLLTTAIMLCTVESFRANSGTLPLIHLKAARALLQEGLKLPRSFLTNGTHGIASFLVERYTYTMILAHITMGSTSDEWVLDDTVLLFQLMRGALVESPGSLSGCVHELFEIIPRVSVFAKQCNAGSSAPQVSAERRAEYAELTRAAASWRPRAGDDIEAVCGKIYQQALLVYLASTWATETLGGRNEAGMLYPAAVAEAFDQFIPLLESIPVRSSISTSLCWPLAIFGSCALTRYHQDIIRRRLDDLSQAYSAQNVKDTKTLLEKLWTSDGSLMRNPLSFEMLMREDKLTVLFF